MLHVIAYMSAVVEGVFLCVVSLAEQRWICYTVARLTPICELWCMEVKEKSVCEQLTIAVSNTQLSCASCRFGNSCQKVTCHVCCDNTNSLPTIFVKWKTRVYSP